MRAIAGIVVASSCAVTVGLAPAAQAAPTTRITVWIDCEGCEIAAVNAKDYFRSNGDNPIYWKRATVTGGKATLRVPRSLTRAMAFQVQAPPYDLGGSTPTVALSRHGKRGSWCWAGTTSSTATLRLQQRRWIDHDVPEAAPGHYNMAVWASPSVRTWRDAANMHRLRSGGLGTQTYPACESR